MTKSIDIVDPISEKNTKLTVKYPSFYKVIILNDDYTPMDFVVNILIQIFQKTEAEAVQIMLAIHHQNTCIAGIYSKEVAEEKVKQTRKSAKINGYPLNCIIEPEG